MGKIQVLIVDDSAVVRQTLTEILQSDPMIEVMGTAPDPYIAADRIERQMPDVITLDIEMPRMDGLTFLRKLMEQHPIPVVMCTSMTDKGCDATLKALEYGAVDVIAKPVIGAREYLKEAQITICDTIKAAVRAHPKRARVTLRPVEEKHTADVMLPKPVSGAVVQKTDRVIVVGASTGGTEALKVFLEALPPDSPGCVVVQHMPGKFTKSFADRLNDTCEVNVREAKTGDHVERGTALIAPGDFHTLLKCCNSSYFVEIKEGPLVSRHRPSADILFRSAARYAGKNAIGVILTGMGDDGAQGILELHQAGAYTIAQNEETCVVFGMPKEAIERGGVDSILPLQDIARAVLAHSGQAHL